MMRLAVALVAVLMWIGTAEAQTPAAETPEEREARELYEKGVKAYDIADYDAAIESFKASYKISSAPLLLYNIAQAYRLKGDCRQGLQFYKNYLRNDPTGPQAAKAEKRIPDMEKCAANQQPTDLPPPVGDGATTGDDTPPIDDEIEHPKVDPQVEPTPPAVVKADPRVDTGTRRPGRTRKLVGLVTAGVGVAAIATGVYFGLQARDASNKISDLYDMPGVVDWSLMYESLESQGKRDEKLFLAFTIGGAAAVVGGGVLWFLGWRADKAARESTVTIAPTPGGAAAVWTGSF